MTPEQKRKERLVNKIYAAGVKAHNEGKPDDLNPYSSAGQPLERCAWAGGWHDARRGMA